MPMNKNIKEPLLDTELNNSDIIIITNPEKKIKKRYLFISIFSLEINSKKPQINVIIIT